MPIRTVDPPRGVLRAPVSGNQQFSHARYQPSPDLAGFIEHYWSVTWGLRADQPSRVDTLPHPTVHLIFETGKGGRIGGVSRGKFSTLLSGTGRIFAAKFRPGGCYPFVRQPVAGYSGRILTIPEVWGPGAAWIGDSMMKAEDEDERMMLMEGFLRQRNPVADRSAAATGAMAESIATDRSLSSAEELGRRHGLTLRTLQRRFARYIGVNPKWVIQRYRLHEAAEQLVQQPASQAALALELGYADQAHLVKDFKAMVGMSPAAYARQAGGQ